jgi:phage FluMu protein Com
MAMTISCPSCNKALRIGEENQGKKMRCPACQQIFKAPTLDEPAGDPDEREDADERRKPEPPPRRRREEDEDDRPSRRGRDEDDWPSRRDRDDYSERPSRRAAAFDDEDDRPRRRRDEDEDDRPRRRRRDDDDYDRPRRFRRQDMPNAVGYIIGGVAVTLLCCLPGGIATIVFAVVANSKASSGDYDGAVKALNGAKICMWVSVGLGLIVNIIWIMANVAATNQPGPGGRF